MRGSADTVKDRLDIVDVVGAKVQLEKAGRSFKGRCPFHHEKTGSFFVSPERRSYYCFGCGEKGDIFTFIEKTEGVDFKTALSMLAEKAGVELEYKKADGPSKTEKDKLFEALEDAASFFEAELQKMPDVLEYLRSRGVSEESIKRFRIGFAPDEWRTLDAHMARIGYAKDVVKKAGLIKEPPENASGKPPYDVFRARIMFPLADQTGRIIAFSGRALGDAVPKYLNSPDTVLFKKSDTLYGLDKAKDDIRRKDFAILVEGQIDLVLAHQAGIRNTVASSGTAFTSSHFSRLKRLSPRIILSFDGDEAGWKAAERSAALGLFLGLEVKVAELPEGKDPADLVRSDPEEWKGALRDAKHAVEAMLVRASRTERDPRKFGKEIERKVLPMLVLIQSSIERAHFVSVIAKHTGLREEVIWDDLKRTKAPEMNDAGLSVRADEKTEEISKPMADRIHDRLAEIALWKKELGDSSIEEKAMIEREEKELEQRLALENLEVERRELQRRLLDSGSEESDIIKQIDVLNRKIDEYNRKVV